MIRVKCLTEEGLVTEFSFVEVPRISDYVQNMIDEERPRYVVTLVTWAIPGGTPTIRLRGPL